MPRYLVERVFPERWAISLTDAGAAICQEVVARNADLGVTWIHSYVGEARKTSFCVYDGPTPEAIRRATKRNRLPVDRIIQVTVLDRYFYR